MAGTEESFCSSSEHVWRPNRREFLFVGLVGSLGLTLGKSFALQAATPGEKARAQSVINIFLPGGISAQESFDPRLLAPIEYRGPLGTVKTKLEGVHFSDQLQQTAEGEDQRRREADDTQCDQVHGVHPVVAEEPEVGEGCGSA